LRQRFLSSGKRASPSGAVCPLFPEEALVIAQQAKVPLEQLSTQHFVSEVAKLGGFPGRSSDGQRGWQTLFPSCDKFYVNRSLLRNGISRQNGR
jgi:hypothetical protein